MKKCRLFALFVLFVLNQTLLSAQNLVVNSYAEDLPRGTGWTVISQGSSACALVPTSNFLNWTMIPDGTANYPYDHTTGVAGGTVFFSGCSPFLQGPFELRQDIDVSADAATIDAGAMLYVFTGHMQTPVSNQTDQGRFIVDYLDASSAVLGSGYTSSWQSYFGGSGNEWHVYSDSRTAPIGTRIIRIRLQTQILFNPPAINVYFDDITLVKPVALPVKLKSFMASETGGQVQLKWTVAEEPGFLQYELERSDNGTAFSSIAIIKSGRFMYDYTDLNYNNRAGAVYYRLKMMDNNERLTYSGVVSVRIKNSLIVKISPNPANNYFIISGAAAGEWVNLFDISGKNIMTARINGNSNTINVAAIPGGLYFIKYNDGKTIVVKKLIVQH